MSNITDDDIRRVFLAAGFTIKEGHDDLKPYVYEAGRKLAALAVAQERERWEQERNDYRSLLMQARVVLRGPHAQQNIVVRELVACIEARGVQFGGAVQPPYTGKEN